jgi:hypothetical protein
MPGPVTSNNFFCNASSTTLNEAVANVEVHPNEPRADWMLRVRDVTPFLQKTGVMLWRC